MAAPYLLSRAAAQVPQAYAIPDRDYEALGIDTDPIGGHPLTPEKQVLFTDYRHIETGDIGWFDSGGNVLPTAGPPGEPIAVQARVGMTPWGVRLQATKAKFEGPLQNGPPGRSIFDNGTYRCWTMKGKYPPGKDLGSYSVEQPTSISILYHESKDGYDWQEKGSCEIPVGEVTAFDGYHFFIDPHGKPEERYKGIFNAGVIDNSSTGAELWKRYAKIHPIYRHPLISAKRVCIIFGLTSPDGINWKRVEKPLMMHLGDTDNTVYYDEWLGKYVLYTRQYWFRRRMIGRAVSEDFLTWSPAEPIIWPDLGDPLSHDIYLNCRTSYPGLPSYHLMFPMVYRRFDQSAEIQMYSSIDGRMWHRLPGGPIVESGDFNGERVEFLNVAGDLLPLKGDKLALRFSGNSSPHKYPRWPGVNRVTTGWSWWPKGRLAAVVADEQGEFSTFKMPMLGKQLRLNARTARAGEIRVGLSRKAGGGALEDVIIEEKDRSVDVCDPINGDSHAHVVSWKGQADIGTPAGSEFSLHFKLRKAELFGFEWIT
jgi:hypothetical protein